MNSLASSLRPNSTPVARLTVKSVKLSSALRTVAPDDRVVRLRFLSLSVLSV